MRKIVLTLIMLIAALAIFLLFSQLTGSNYKIESSETFMSPDATKSAMVQTRIYESESLAPYPRKEVFVVTNSGDGLVFAIQADADDNVSVSWRGDNELLVQHSRRAVIEVKKDMFGDVRIKYHNH